jgi:hypothetical protein
MVNVGFDEDSNWLDITDHIRKGRNQVSFKALNKTGAITYLFQVRKDDSIIFERTCGAVKVVGCENNKAYRIGVAAQFTVTIRK